MAPLELELQGLVRRLMAGVGVGWGGGAGNESRSSGRVRSSLDQLVADAAPQMPQTAGAAESEQVRCGKS